MTDPLPTFTIGIPVYQGVEPLDVVGAYEVFTEMGQMVEDRCTVNVYLLAEYPGVITTRLGMYLLPHRTFSQVGHLDLLWVPGGSSEALSELMRGGPYLDALRHWAGTARYVTSVCNGAMLLAAAGLLNGYNATTHWAYYPCFASFPQITPEQPTGDEWPRIVVDGNRITGGGVSSALDEALAIVQTLFGTDVAEKVQVDIQYFPKPPVNGTIPQPTECELALSTTAPAAIS